MFGLLKKKERLPSAAEQIKISDDSYHQASKGFQEALDELALTLRLKLDNGHKETHDA